MRLPEYRSSYRLRFHPYAARRPALYCGATAEEYVFDSQHQLALALPDLSGGSANTVLESFFRPPTPTIEVQNIQVRDADQPKRRLRLVSVADVIAALRMMLRALHVFERQLDDKFD